MHRLLDRQRGYGLDKNHAPVLQAQLGRQWTVDGVDAIWSLRVSIDIPWTGPLDKAEVLQGEVDDGGAGVVDTVPLGGEG